MSDDREKKINKRRLTLPHNTQSYTDENVYGDVCVYDPEFDIYKMSYKS